MKKKITLFLTLIVLGMGTATAQQKYAVLFGGNNYPSTKTTSFKDDLTHEEAIWNDTFLMWELLYTKAGFPHENITVLHGDGRDYVRLEDVTPAPRYDPQEHPSGLFEDGGYLTTAATYKHSLINKLEEVANNVNEDDFFVLLVFTHGMPGVFGCLEYKPEPDPGSGPNSTDMTVDELKPLLDAINCRKVVLMQQCFGGSFIELLQNESTIIMTAAADTTWAWPADKQYMVYDEETGTLDTSQVYEAEDERETYYEGGKEHWHAEWLLHLNAALAGEMPNYETVYKTSKRDFPLDTADLNNDGFVTMYEAHQHNIKFNSMQRLTYWNDEYRFGDMPQLSDLGNMAHYTSMKYPTLLHGTITQPIVARGNVGISTDTYVEQNGIVTFVGNMQLAWIGNSNFSVEAGGSMIIEDNVNFEIPEGSTLIVNQGADVELKALAQINLQTGGKIVLNENAHLVIPTDATLAINDCAEIEILPGAKITIEAGGILCIHPDAILNVEGHSAFEILGEITIGESCVHPYEIVPPSYRITEIDTEWINGDYRMVRNLEIEAEASLKLNDVNLRFLNDKIITVEPGGHLEVNGGKLTNEIFSCQALGGWNGIYIKGNPNLPQISENQGTAILKNGAIVENANIAVQVGNILTPPWPQGNGGGILIAEDVTFKNNYRSVFFAPYTPLLEATQQESNLSYFDNCTFITDRLTLFDAHVYKIMMNRVNGIKFNNCSFQDVRKVITYDISQKGIYSTNSSFFVDNCEFKNLQYGIYAFNTTTIQRGIDVQHSSFSNFRDIYLLNMDNSRILDNDFNTKPEIIQQGETCNHYNYGLYIDNSI